MANSTLNIVCPKCEATNRVPANRIGERPQCGKCHGKLFTAHPVTLTTSSLEKHVTRSDLPLVVDFWAPWCGPCKVMAPAFEQAATELEPRARLGKLDTEADGAIGARFHIRSIPTLVLFRQGREIARQSGALRASDIVRWVTSHL